MRPAILLFFASLAQASTIATYTFPITPGVAHPLQIACVPQDSFNPLNAKLQSPNGVDETPYQKTAGQICMQIRLPPPTNPIVFASVPTPHASGSISWDDLTTGGGFILLPVGTPVLFQATSPTCISDNTVVFIARNNYYLDNGIEFSATPGGSVINCTAGGAYGTAAKITVVGFTCVGSTDVCTSPNHGFLDRDPISFVGSGAACPSGITCNGTTVYYVRDVTANTFKPAATVGGSAINIGDASGLNQILPVPVWTLVTGTPSAIATNPINIDLSNPAYAQVTNGLTGFRSLRANCHAYTVSGGTLTSLVSSGGVVTANFPGARPSTITVGSKVMLHFQSSLMGGPYTVATTPSSSSFTAAEGFPGTYNGSLAAVSDCDTSQDQMVGAQLADGTWATTTPLAFAQSDGGHTVLTSPSESTPPAVFNLAYSWHFVEAGPLKTVIESTYTGYKPALKDRIGQAVTGSVEDQNGTFTKTFTFLANSKTVSVKLSGNENYGSRLSLDTAKFDRIGNRAFGRTAGSTSNDICGLAGPIPIASMTGNGVNPIVIVTTKPHGMTGSTGNNTATITGVGGNTAANTTAVAGVIDQYTFSIPVTGNGAYTSGGSVSYGYTDGSNLLRNVTKAISYAGDVDITPDCTSVYRPPLGIYSTHATGGIQQWVYKDGGASNTPIVAIWPGRGSNQSYSLQSTTGFSSLSTPALYAYANLNPCFDCGSTGGVFGSFSSGITRETVYYFGTLADVTPNGRPQDPSPMSSEQNWVTGMSLDNLYSYDLAYPDPVGGPVFPYMNDTDVGTIRFAYQAGGAFKTLIDASRGNNAIATLATWFANNSASIDTSVLDSLKLSGYRFLNCLVNGDGLFGFDCSAVNINIALGATFNTVTDALANPNVTAAQTTALKATLAILCDTALDTDIIPSGFNGLGDGFSQNQVIGIIAAQQRCVSGLPTNPYTVARRGAITSTLIGLINTAFNSYGSCAGSFHYCGSDLGNLLFVILSEVKLNGLNPNLFPSLGKYLEWLRDGLTPPDPRFNMARVLPPVGDGTLQLVPEVGHVATIYKDFDSTASQLGRGLMGCMSTSVLVPIADFFGSGMTAYDSTITDPGCANIGTKTSNHPGWYSVLRDRFGEAMKENYTLMVNGTWYSDHKHYDNLSLYSWMLGVPMIDDPELNLNAFTGSCVTHSTMCLESGLTTAWTAAMTNSEMGPTGPVNFGTPAAVEVLDLDHVEYMKSTEGSTHTREVTLISDDADYPIQRIHDTITGASTSAAKIFTTIFNYSGAVGTPAGNVTPTSSAIDCSGNGVVGPGSAVALGSGIRMYTVHGDTYSALGAGGNGIDTDVALVRQDSGDQVVLAEMHHSCALPASATTNDLFFKVRTVAGMDMILLPHVKSGSASANPTAITGGYQVVNGSNTTTFGDNFVTFTDGTAKKARALNTATVTAHNITLSGGPSGITMSSSTAGVWTVTGMSATTPCVDLSSFGGIWYANGPVTNPSANKFCVAFPGGQQPTPRVITLSTTSGTRRTVKLSIPHPTAAYMDISIAGNPVARATCGAVGSVNVCPASILTPTGNVAYTYQPRDGSGVAIGNLGTGTLQVN